MGALYIADFKPRPVIAVDFKRNPETGVLTVRYPISWVGLAEYTLGEVRRGSHNGGADIPAPYCDMPDNTIIRVLHRPEQVAAPSFVKSCFMLPLMRGVHAAEGLHMLRPGDSEKVVGVFGRDLQMREVNGVQVPTLDAIITDLQTQVDIANGADESSLSYTCGHDWTGGTWDGIQYHMEHVLDQADPRIAELVARVGPPRANHCTIALYPGDSRGYRRTAVFLDSRANAHGARYAEPMKFNLNAAAARRMPPQILALAGIPAGKVADGPITIEIPDSDVPAIAAFAQALAAATSQIATGAEEAAAGLAEAQAQLAELSAAMPELEADAAVGRKARLDQARAEAIGLGCPADKLTAADSVDAVREVAVLHLVPALAKSLPVVDAKADPAARAARTADRRHAINVAWQTLAAAATKRQSADALSGTRSLASDTSQSTVPSDGPAANDSAAREFFGLVSRK